MALSPDDLSPTGKAAFERVLQALATDLKAMPPDEKAEWVGAVLGGIIGLTMVTSQDPDALYDAILLVAAFAHDKYGRRS